MRRLYAFTVLLCAAGGVLCQEQAQPYTLRVYTNRIQVPTLVLDRQIKPIPQPDTKLALKQFAISLDAGRPFEPTDMHVQGDDPIDLAIVLDLSGRPKLSSQLAAWLEKISRDLAQRDRVSVYAFHCEGVRTADHVVASPGLIGRAVTRALAADLSRKPGTPECNNSGRFWLTVGTAMHDLAQHNGRHAILVFSNGWYERRPLSTFVRFASRNQVTVVGVRNDEFFPQGGFAGQDLSEDALVALCTRTGGYVFTVRRGDFERTIQSVVPDLRSRYILEFPRPDQYTAVDHTIDVRVPSARQDIVLPGGAFSTPDPTDKNDPNVIKTAPSPAILGGRHPIGK